MRDFRHPTSIIIANHTSLSDPAIVLAALRRLGTEPTVLVAAELWRIRLLGRILTREGHIPVHCHDPRAAQALQAAQATLAVGRSTLLYPEGGLPPRKDTTKPRPGASTQVFSSSHAPPTPRSYPSARPEPVHWHQAPIEQVARLLTAPLRRPKLHVHLGTPLHLDDEQAQALAQVRSALTRAWYVAARRLDEPKIPVT